NYWAMYPDVKNAGWRPYAHYQSSGQNEGRTWPTSGSTPFCFESTKKITCGNVDTGPNDTCGTNKAPVTPAPVVCTPNSCAANTLVGQTCNDGCGGTQNGTKTNCTPNQKTCSGNILNTCNSMGTVLTPTTCTYGCSNGACNLATAKISFKFAFAGVKPNASCISSLGNLKIEVGNSPANKYQGGLTTGFSVIAGSVDSAGNQIFKTDSIALSNDFASVNNNNYVKVKGLLHLKRRMCQEGQLTKINNDTTICNINLIRTDDYVYDFSKYAFITTDNSNFYGLLAGDVNSDGVINSIDFSYVKSRIDADSDITCGREGDLNADGVVNNLDTGLIKIALSSKDDE
ncbi:MAG: dockerin type I repeat-containing protein, partial [Candidatus Shapirobacteria bacterium]